MGRILTTILFAIIISAATVSGQERPYIVFWNLENYFDPFDDPDTEDGDFTPDGEKGGHGRSLSRNGIL